MSTSNRPAYTLEEYLNRIRPLAVERIVVQARQELSDYRQRDVNELTAAVTGSYNNWCEAILKNDFQISVSNSKTVIERSVKEHRDPAQVARTPWIICEVTLKLLEEGAHYLDPEEKAAFCATAHKLTKKMSTMGQLKIASALVGEAMTNLKA